MKKLVATVLLVLGSLMTTTPASAAAYIPADCQGFTGNIICASKGQNRVILVHNEQVVRSDETPGGPCKFILLDR